MEDRVKKLSPEEKQRRLELKRRRKKILKITNAVYFATAVVCVSVFVFSVVTWLMYAIPASSADGKINEAKSEYAKVEEQINSVADEKATLEKEVDELLGELEKYNDD